MAPKKQSDKPNKLDKPDILLISGSPRARTCEALIALIEQGARKTGAKTQRFLLSKKHILPCLGCGACEKTGTCILANRTKDKHFIDDYLELKAVLERVDAVAIVAPLFFAGPPAQLKALYDRMQPYWAQRYLLGIKPPAKRPAQLFVVGGGGDEHGYTPLATITKSAIAVAGFNLEKVNNFIGFAAPKDAPTYPAEAELDRYSHAQLAKLKRGASEQAAFCERAIDAGSAFARYVVKKKEANILEAQLAEVEAELAALNEVGNPDTSTQATEESAVGSTRRARSVAALSDAHPDRQAEVDLDYSKLITSVDKGDE
jgi:multimeric flavodoxin WrbA